MDRLSERIAYLRGLAEGLGVDGSTKEGKMITAIIDTLDLIHECIDDMDYAGEINFICPNCNEPIEIDDFLLESEDHIICPKCNEPISILTQEI